MSECRGRYRGGCTCNLHTFQDRSDKVVIESVLYMSQDMFGDIQFEAEEELKHRYPPPEWASKHMKPEELPA